MLYAPLASALIKMPFWERYKPRFTRLPLKECVFLGSYFLGKESSSTKLAFEVPLAQCHVTQVYSAIYL